MANKKNKINELVTDDDPTAELEIPSIESIAAFADAENESDANTFDYVESAESPAADDAIQELQSDLKTRSETISRLQLDCEQLRVKWLGLDAEIRAREEQTKKLNQELQDANSLRARLDGKLKKRNQLVKSLKAEIRQREDDFHGLQVIEKDLRIASETAAQEKRELVATHELAEQRARELEQELVRSQAEQKSTHEHDEQAREEISELRHAVHEGQQTIAELRQYIDGRQTDWTSLNEKLALQEKAIAALTATEEALRADVGRVRDDNEKLNHEVASRDAANRKLRESTNNLQRELDALRDADSDSAKRIVNEQAGQLASMEMTIKDLRGQMDRTEVYADTLRRQMHDLITRAGQRKDEDEYLQSSLKSAKQRVAELEADQDREKRLTAELRKDLDDAREAHELEVRTIRFELGAAQQTMAEHESVSEQLASDLIDTRAFRDELEIMLGDNTQKTQTIIEALEKKNRKLENEIESYKQKLETKNEAVNCLLSELAKKNQQIESIDQIEEVIHEIDNRMSERFDERPAGDRDRITRVLTGTIDGQELRFPLFKNRLTIGRTQTNDIQIEAAYISRRHAVIVTDNEATRIVDWGSKNGVSVNGARISEHFLKNGDVVTIGTANFKYEERPKRDS